MKIIIILVLSSVFLFIGCANNQSPPSGQAAKNTAPIAPEVGMTKDQVRKIFGSPVYVNVHNADGELWTCVPNKSLGYIPFNVAYRPRNIVIIFDSNGLVKAWSDKQLP